MRTIVRLGESIKNLTVAIPERDMSITTERLKDSAMRTMNIGCVVSICGRAYPFS